ncbi:MAG: hypothetical protein AMJ73_03765 [candidate division Zixibacteria bacterium SM1_73]|nr:MAG: hypothetical protein AMJ73_03765 [candidate division Zixibacteria bacterium SM1_73]
MKKRMAFIILYSFLWILWTLLILCTSTNAQWEDAQVQRLTYNDVPDGIVGLYIEKDDKMYLFYREGAIKLISKKKNGGWSQPEEIWTPPGGGWNIMQIGYDTNTGIIHIAYARFLSLAYDTLYYTNSEMPDWQLLKIDSLSNEKNARYQSLAMAFDTLGNVHLIWNVQFDSVGYGDWYRVMYANNSTGEWVKQQISAPIWVGGFIGGPSYLAVQKNGAAHIVYHGEPYCDLECSAFYVRNDGLSSTNWITDTVPKPSRPLWHYWAGPIKVDVNDRVHLITFGCTEEDCVWPGLKRWFYYYKEDEDSLWVGPELILDSLFYFTTIFIDSESAPYVVEWDKSTYCWFFTDRKQGFWQEPYQIFDTTSMCNGLSSIYPRGPCFVLDSQGQGHAVFEGSLFEFMGVDDSLEIFYFGAPSTSVEDTLEEESKFRFQLFQNYPNPFNAVTKIQYTVGSPKDPSDRQSRLIHTTLKIYNILGKEVRELVNTRQSPGNYTIIWDGKDNNGKEVASGIYFYQLTVRQAHPPEQSRGKAGNYKETRKLVLIK